MKIKILRNLFMRLSIPVLHHVFLSWLNVSSELDMKQKWEIGKASELDVTEISCLKIVHQVSLWLICDFI